MKAGFTTVAKVLAILLSLSLLGAYVWWRSDQAKQEQARLEALQEAREKAIEAARAKQGLGDPGAELILKELEMMGSSKSGIVMPSTKKAPVVLPGPKSFDPVPQHPHYLHAEEEEFLRLVEQARKAKEQKEKERIILPGSKSGGARLEDIPRLKELFKEQDQQPQHQK